MNFEPYGDKIVVKPFKKEKTDTGIFIPETEDMAHIMRGEVVAVSKGFVSGNKEWSLNSILGDVVVFQKALAIPFRFDGEDLLILQESAIFGRELK